MSSTTHTKSANSQATRSKPKYGLDRDFSVDSYPPGTNAFTAYKAIENLALGVAEYAPGVRRKLPKIDPAVPVDVALAERKMRNKLLMRNKRAAEKANPRLGIGATNGARTQ